MTFSRIVFFNIYIMFINVSVADENLSYTLT